MSDTTVLIVGAGPTGLATALSLVQSGFRDFIIVEAAASRAQASRALSLHAATLESLAAVGCADALIEHGTKGTGMCLSNDDGPFLRTTTSSLEPYTPYPYVLLLSQRSTEEVLETKLNELGVEILRPERAVGLKSTPEGRLQVSFESGRTISTRYVVAADGSKSTIRQIAGVGFADPDGHPPDERLLQMVLADVTFSSDSPHLPKNEFRAFFGDNKGFLIAPLPKQPGSTEDIYRIGFSVPLSHGPPPHNPPTEYLQQYVNTSGPEHFSSDPTVNPSPVHISRTIWATRFRTHSAIADTFLVRMHTDRRDTGIVLFVGDAAHIHSPAGGQGMNLGIRDAIHLGPALVAHIASTPESLAENDKRLEEYAAARRLRALTTIRLTKRIMAMMSMAGSTKLLGRLGFFIIKALAKIPFVQSMYVWNISGLGNR